MTVWMILAGVVGLTWIVRFFAVGRALQGSASGGLLTSASHPDKTGHESPKIDASQPTTAGILPHVTVIVAAKDEQDNIEACITSLLDQDYPNYQVIAVDDRSTDRTPAILRELEEKARAARANNRDGSSRQPSVCDSPTAELRVVTIRELREGWFGKNNAMREGVAAGDRPKGDHWLMFTDADCRQTSRRTLTVAVREALASDCDFLSITPVLETHTRWERIIQPVCAAVLIIWFLPSRVNNPKCKTAYANGAFMLIRRDCYEAIGGHESVKQELNEDIVFAQLAKGRGFRLRVVENKDLYATRMYATPMQAFRGWSRIFAGSLRTVPRVLLALFFIMFFSLQPWVALSTALIGCLVSVGDSGAVPPTVTSAWSMSDWSMAAWVWAGVVFFEQATMWRMYGVLRFRRTWSFTYLIGAVTAFAMLVNALLKACGARSTTWRGTTYRQGHLADGGEVVSPDRPAASMSGSRLSAADAAPEPPLQT